MIPGLSRQEVTMSKEEVDRYIYEVGSGVIDASVFQAGYFQKHHMRTSVAAHTLNVAQSSVYMGRFLTHLGFRVNMQDLVLASLCHDLGIVGRYSKYANNRECCNRHPLDSAALAKKLVPNADDVVLNSVECHMWPIGPTGHPNHIEGFIVTVADKYSSVKDLLRPNGWDRGRNPAAKAGTTRQDASSAIA